MQTYWQVKEGHDTLLLVFSGWAMDERAMAHLSAAGCDICTCFNYTDLHSDDFSEWKTYARVKVVAWSMGVWASEKVLPSLGLNIVQAVAVNGTVTPVDDRCGIPVHIARGTCDNLTPASFMKFLKRVSAGFKFVPAEGLEGRKEELARIIAADKCQPLLKWSKAVVSRADAIFPPENLLRFWQGRCRIVEIDAPHYPFHLFKNWEAVLDE